MTKTMIDLDQELDERQAKRDQALINAWPETAQPSPRTPKVYVRGVHLASKPFRLLRGTSRDYVRTVSKARRTATPKRLRTPRSGVNWQRASRRPARKRRRKSSVSWTPTPC